MATKYSFKKRLTLCCSITLPCLFALLIGLGCIDEDLEDYSHLIPKNPEILSDEDNALHDYLSAIRSHIKNEDANERIDEIDLYHLRDGSFDSTFWQQIVENNEKAIKHFEDGVLCKGVYHPCDYTLESSTPYISIVNFCSDIRARITLSALSNNWDSVHNDLQLLRHAGQRCYWNDSNLVSNLISRIFYSAVLDQCITLLNDPQLPASSRTVILNNLQEISSLDLPKLRQHCFETLKGEFLFNRNIIHNISADDISAPTNPYSFHKNEAINQANLHFSALLNAKNKSLYELSILIHSLHDKLQFKSKFRLDDTPLEIIKPAYTNHVYYNLVLSEVTSRQLLIHSMFTVSVDLILLREALKDYEHTHGSLPATLTLLATHTNIHDPFAKPPNTPYQYSTKTRKIWSVGINFTDEGGQLKDHIFSPDESRNEQPAEDYVLPLHPNKLNL